jgi:hypothetical protein
MYFSIPLIAAAISSTFFGFSDAAAQCSDTKDHNQNGSSRNNTLTAGMDLMSYFNDPTRNGVLSLPAQGSGSSYAITRQVGKSDSV